MRLGKKFVVTDKNVTHYISWICEWINEQVRAAGRDGIVLGLSGGVDSAVVARLVQQSGVPLKVLLLPDGEKGQRAQNFLDAQAMAEQFDLDYRVIDIGLICRAMQLPADDSAVQNASDNNRNLARINIAPRIRANMLYQIAQLERLLVIGTDNMAEQVTGYFTKFGDGAYDFCPLGFMTKSEVYNLANALDVPQAIINKPPSADLWDGQTDEAELGFSYKQIDEWILYGGGNDEVSLNINYRYKMTEHKRQMPPLFNA
jgi:NAD+ synthase